MSLVCRKFGASITVVAATLCIGGVAGAVITTCVITKPDSACSKAGATGLHGGCTWLLDTDGDCENTTTGTYGLRGTKNYNQDCIYRTRSGTSCQIISEPHTYNASCQKADGDGCPS